MEKDEKDILEQSRRQEQSKYEWINNFKKENPRNGYGSGFHGRKAEELIKSLDLESVIDVGTGCGEFCKMCHDIGIKRIYGVDFAIDPKPTNKADNIVYIKAFAHSLPFEDKSVDAITSFDMLEHLLEDDVDNVFTEFSRIAKRYFVFTINHNESRSFHKQLGNLHPTVRPRVWWLDKLRAYGDVYAENGVIRVVL